jgi:hypothetical protein
MTAAGRPGCPVWFIDLAGMRCEHQPLSTPQVCKDLTRLNASFVQSTIITRTDRLRFLRIYLLLNWRSGVDWKSVWRQIEALTQRKQARNARVGRVLK